MGALAQQPKGPAPGRGKLPASFRSSSAQTSGHSDAHAAHPAGLSGSHKLKCRCYLPRVSQQPQDGHLYLHCSAGQLGGGEAGGSVGSPPGQQGHPREWPQHDPTPTPTMCEQEMQASQVPPA